MDVGVQANSCVWQGGLSPSPCNLTSLQNKTSPKKQSHVYTISNHPELTYFSLQVKGHLPCCNVSLLFVQVDEGGSKRFFQNMWTSFLKARLVCGFPDESLYFNRLLDIHVIHADDWRSSRVYALFSSSWFDTFPSFYNATIAVT